MITADGVCEGVVLEAPRGTGGFGYDPLFLVPELGQTFAELGVGTKGELSHRARAMQAIKPRLLAYLQQLRLTAMEPPRRGTRRRDRERWGE